MWEGISCRHDHFPVDASLTLGKNVKNDFKVTEGKQIPAHLQQLKDINSIKLPQEDVQ